MRFEKERVAGSFLASFRTGANWLRPRVVRYGRPRTQERSVAGDSLR